MFAQIQQMVQQNPALLQPLLQQLAQSHPALAQSMAENPELLYALLGTEGAAPGAAGAGFEDEEGPVPPGAQVISVTQEERAAIDRVSVVCLVHEPRLITCTYLFLSSLRSASHSKQPLKLTLRAGRTKNLLPTFYSRMGLNRLRFSTIMLYP